MKVAILMLSYERFDTLSKVLPSNMVHAAGADLFVLDQGSTDPRVLPFLKEYAKEVFTLPDNVGISKGFNFLLKYCYDLGYDAFQFIANDIMEPVGWITEKVKHLQAIPESGMVSIALADSGYCTKRVNGMWIHPGHVIGQFIISRATYEKLGALREDFGMYGPIDLDYNLRCEKLGLINYYIPCLRAVHMDDRANDLYGYDKAQKVSDTWPEFINTVSRYEDRSNCHIPNGEYTINADQYHVQ
ncbi:glycosyltransferase family 2 protein [Chitinophaga cymbidii]|uniref:Glycosyltransferase 2-like domain-containing protein n=1 Tax=Chitinophaga cymbidii TaxID=1096750 RepID=A0A512RIN9_9BACT|nr:glycosyltransferase family 2 protein [Chitinophaga cymbidii]GEP95555.1 hypothetical protein CCY01nite_18150 [Chitinophaga cymbidii]